MQPDLDEVVVTADPLPVGHLATRVVCPTVGAIATFVGTTRTPQSPSLSLSWPKGSQPNSTVDFASFSSQMKKAYQAEHPE